MNLFVLYIIMYQVFSVFLPVSPDSFRRVLWPVFLWFLRMCLDMLLVLKWLKRCSNIGQFYSNSLICLPCAVLAERSRHTLWSALRSSLTFHYLPRRFVFTSDMFVVAMKCSWWLDFYSVYVDYVYLQTKFGLNCTCSIHIHIWS